MKYIIGFLTAILLTTGFTIAAEAQVMNRLKKRAKEAAERKAEEKLAEQVEQLAEQMVEKSWDSIFGEMNRDSLSGRTFPFALNSNVPTEDLYDFDTITTMNIETTKKDGSSEPPVVMEMHFKKDAMYTGTKFSSDEMKREENDLFIIYDYKNAAMVMLMRNKNDKFSFAYDWNQALEQAQSFSDSLSADDQNWDETEYWGNYTKIGKKSILGYDCDGYRSEADEQITEIWVSREGDWGMTNMFRANANAKYMRGKIPDEYPQGMVMELSYEDLKDGNKTIMKVTDINKNARVLYTMADYPAMSLSPKANR